MKSSGIGGQAVLEGVMMKNKETYAIAVRKPDNEIAVEINKYKGINEKLSFFKLPILRGIAAFADSLYIGTKALTFSSTFFEDEDEKAKKKDNNKKDGFFTFITFFLSIAIAVGVFILFPLFLSNLISEKIDSVILLGLIEGVIRVALFVGYVVAISQMKDIKRFFQYHGAEHKTINCIERGHELTVSNVRRQSKEHRRCGTSFILFIMLISIVLFMFIQVDTVALRYVLRILLVPVVAGISYEFIRLAGRSDNIIVRILSKPGLWMQRLTTKEPDDSMIEVAIASVEAVFDWRAYLEANGKKSGKKNKKSAKSGKVEPVKKSNNVKLEKSEVAKKDTAIEGSKSEVAKKNQKSQNANQISNHNKNTSQKTSSHEETAATIETANASIDDELDALDKILFEGQQAEEKHEQLMKKAKSHSNEQFISSAEIATSLEPDEDEEDDEILMALDRFFENNDK